MTCKQVSEFLADYLEGTLPWRRKMSFKVHLLLCRHCRRYLASYAATVQLTKSLGRPVELVAEQIPEELVRAILNARAGQVRPEAKGRSSVAEQ